MEERLKKRLIGATVLISLAIIFVPMMLEDRSDEPADIGESNIPPPPAPPAEFASRILPAQPSPSSAPQPRGSPVPPLPPDTPAALPDSVSRPESRPDAAGATAVAGTAGQPPTTRVGLSAWVVQVGSFASKENADQLVSEIKAKELPGFLEGAHVNGQVVYRVRVGPELDRKRAEAMAQRIARELKIQGTVVGYP